ncbi:MAG TPA: hypothetical protein VHD59_14940 [Pseudolabrys sp.]|nr:hypothetical protein [Pseudolabrys sp.]
MRGLLLPIALLSLSACAGVRDPTVGTTNTVQAGEWRIEKQIDRITGAPLESALVVASSSHSSEPFPKKVTMQLACFNKKPLVRFAFETKVGTTYSNEFGYRFDDRPGHQIEAGFLGNDQVAVIENGPDVAQFLDELKDSKTLYLRIRSLAFGRTTADFNVEGADAAMAATTAHCPPVIEDVKRRRNTRQPHR